MHIPVEVKPALIGAAVGAAIAAFLGFNLGGWTTHGRAETLATNRAMEAVVAALAPVCVEKFVRSDGAAASRAALKKAQAWEQGDYVEKGGWASVGNAASPERITAVAKACATLLAAG